MSNNICGNVKPARANIDEDIHCRVFNLIRNFDCSSPKTIHPSLHVCSVLSNPPFKSLSATVLLICFLPICIVTYIMCIYVQHL